MTSTISSKGQITVPKRVRERLGLRSGSVVEFDLIDGGVVVRKGHRGARPVDRVRGVLERTTRTDDVIDDLRGSAPTRTRARR